MATVIIVNHEVDKACVLLRKKTQRDGTFSEIKMRRHFIPANKKAELRAIERRRRRRRKNKNENDQ